MEGINYYQFITDDILMAMGVVEMMDGMRDQKKDSHVDENLSLMMDEPKA